VFGLDTSMDPKDRDLEANTSRLQRWSPDRSAPEVPPWRSSMSPQAFRDHCASVPMSAGKFERDLCRDLIYRGWWLTREAVRTFHPDAITVDPPEWNEWSVL
ncbi:MAG: hypothetical protein AAGE98_14020, partial [Actinomycetota bacterium]